MNSRIQAISVDDEKINLLLIDAMANDLDIDLISFSDPVKAVEHLKSNYVDIVFLDYMMPVMNGLQFIEKARGIQEDVSIIMITSVQDDASLKLNALTAGASDFLNKPLNIAEFKARVSNLVELRVSKKMLLDRAKLLESEVKIATAEIIRREHETLAILARAAEYRDHNTGMHVVRVSHYSRIIAASIGESHEIQDVIFNSSPLHDVGKIGISDSILLKEGPLNTEESQIMKTHPVIGYDMLKDSKSEYLKAGAIISLAHHEKFDGTGYPCGIKGRDIHLYGRIVAIADVYDALSSHRPYKDAWDLPQVEDYLQKNKGTHFDPELVEHFFKEYDAVCRITEEFKCE